MTATVVPLHDPISHARAVRARLWNPPNARRSSSELDIITGRRRQAQIRQQRLDQDKSDETLRRELLLDAGMRNFLDDYAVTKKIAAVIQEEETAEPPKIRVIVQFVADKFKTTPVMLMSQRRTHNVLWPRFIAMYLARELTFRSLPEIGRALGRRDHTTVLHGVRRVKARMETDAEFKEQVEGYQRELASE